MGARGLRMLELPAESGPALEALRQARSAYLAVIAAHERVAGLLVVLGDPDSARIERQAAEGERARLARLDARLVMLGGTHRPASHTSRR
jgi:hypothetical protein